ncbi:triose-phosphate isomerase [Moraxella sp.]|uniref:triose-phosphate isomerase n=1 Tax=Moraxella sp. TaxID=479 RepID=UPI0026DC6276|nr:triose-phosphate isomerase [Moraxella sp.]MDO4894717.1 triose-phosphate isomerase [Moraxella sp.]
MKNSKYVIGNWKTNPATKAQAMELAQFLSTLNGQTKTVQVGCTPSLVHLDAVSGLLSKTDILVGCQDICAFTADVGAYTGDVSAAQLVDTGAQFVLVGHSERRSYYGESTTLLTAKIQQALHADLTVVFCIGETKEQYTAAQTLTVLEEQLAILSSIEVPASKLIIAYEPVWAIGTGLTPTVDEVVNTHRHIQSVLTNMGLLGVSVLYGGSVNASNAGQFAQFDEIGGALVGGASLKADSFAQIIEAFA